MIYWIRGNATGSQRPLCACKHSGSARNIFREYLRVYLSPSPSSTPSVILSAHFLFMESGGTS
ncbi:uncharacterized protein A1O5_08596 [Cladophialophora psammophila CBS 110553]|uniref:Uncharacterized protein n=1 Tax=Cladophialophora psammophila CBS 110553 TaxID=1182543 RepID=W9WIM2_9EURO|nr:uncharacterized protein A1O5_08596 [Cladophialophora psammophila CBS 110553]EXJ67982.1 hypothetical protein A1O5_08596 [Cladophialophora psammophila CBS 110553]